tara:strand:- start:813 stop:971 length:159 start_codon:yes stop_codon:yes gene_type:complete
MTDKATLEAVRFAVGGITAGPEDEALVIKSQDKKISALQKELRARKSILDRN